MKKFRGFKGNFYHKERVMYVADTYLRRVLRCYDAMQTEFNSLPMVTNLSVGNSHRIGKDSFWYVKFNATENMWKYYINSLGSKGLKLVIKETGIYVQ